MLPYGVVSNLTSEPMSYVAMIFSFWARKCKMATILIRNIKMRLLCIKFWRFNKWDPARSSKNSDFAQHFDIKHQNGLLRYCSPRRDCEGKPEKSPFIPFMSTTDTFLYAPQRQGGRAMRAPTAFTNNNYLHPYRRERQNIAAWTWYNNFCLNNNEFVFN